MKSPLYGTKQFVFHLQKLKPCFLYAQYVIMVIFNMKYLVEFPYVFWFENTYYFF